MSDENNRYWYIDDQKPSLRLWIFSQMALGASYAALAFFGVIAFSLILVVISKLLPEDPFAALETGTRLISAFA